MGVLLVLCALQIQRGVSLLPVTIWLDNAEVLERANNPIWDANVKKHLVLDYDLWQAMAGFQELITTPLKWEKVDSHIEGRLSAYFVEFVSN